MKLVGSLNFNSKKSSPIENISILSHSQPIFTFCLNKITHYPLIICDSDIYNYWKVNYNENQFKFA